MLENHGLRPEDIDNFEYKEDVDFKLDVKLEDLESIVEGDEDLEQLLEEMLNSCLRYTETVLKMNMVSKEKSDEDFAQEIADTSDERRRIHNLTIESIDILARTTEKKGKDSSWVEKLRPTPFVDNRSVYGRFAIALTFYRAAQLT